MAGSGPTAGIKQILLVRLDRIGDLVLTLPVDETFQDCAVTWWVPPGLSFVTDQAKPRRKSREISKSVSLKEFFALWRDLRRERYATAIVFHAPWWMSLLLWLARIPVRGGVRSQWHSFLFLNRAVRQKRSRAEYSELEYNYRLVEQLRDIPSGSLARRHLSLDGATASEGVLARLGLTPFTYNVVHPGMGGSALNWPIERYAELIRALLDKSEKVVITGTKTDQGVLLPLRETLGTLSSSNALIWLDGKLNGSELIKILGSARATFAPSTGVLHLAASTGCPTVGIFSPVRVQHPRRWGPQGDKTATLLPQPLQDLNKNGFSCPGEMSCLGSTCPHFDCMDSISTKQALAARESLLI